MLARSTTDKMKESADAGAAMALDLARDRKFRKQLLAALEHGAIARERARRRVGPFATVTRLAADETLRAELTEVVRNLERARRRVEKKRSHRLRNTLLIGSGAAIVAVPASRRWLADRIRSLRGPTQRAPIEDSQADADADADKPISRMTKDELLERARDEGVEVSDEMSRDEVYEALRSRQA